MLQTANRPTSMYSVHGKDNNVSELSLQYILHHWWGIEFFLGMCVRICSLALLTFDRPIEWLMLIEWLATNRAAMVTRYTRTQEIQVSWILRDINLLPRCFCLFCVWVGASASCARLFRTWSHAARADHFGFISLFLHFIVSLFFFFFSNLFLFNDSCFFLRFFFFWLLGLLRLFVQYCTNYVYIFPLTLFAACYFLFLFTSIFVFGFGFGFSVYSVCIFYTVHITYIFPLSFFLGRFL